MDEISIILRFFQVLPKRFSFKHLERVLIDVGAHVGNSTRPFAERGWQVYCFEPESTNYLELTNNMASYPKVQCFQAAVSDQNAAEVPFYVSNEHWGIHSLRPFHSSHQVGRGVSSTRLDTFLSTLSIKRVDFLKIDVEGADFLVLKGMDWIKYHPEVVLTEFMDSRTQSNFGYTFHDMVHFMFSFGYRCFVFEYGPITEYGRKGDMSILEPEFLGAYPYREDIKPVWGNLIFYLAHNSEYLENSINDALSHIEVLTHPSQGRSYSFIPVPLRFLFRPIRRWLQRRRG